MPGAGDIFESMLADIRGAGTYKDERVLVSPQNSVVRLADGREVLNFCANNYLGLADHPELVRAAVESLDRYGFGLSSVRFICGTLDLHKELERRVSSFLGMEDTVLYSSCFDANGGLFETILTAEDAVISDELNHASIIDGVRLCKARRLIYKNNDMNGLERRLEEAKDARIRLIATDGVFSMDGIVADLAGICDLAEKHDALVMVDDSHATGFIGDTGRGTHEASGVMGRIDIITSTFGKALGGASGGFTATRKPIADLLRQKSRPYLFSNTLSPTIAATTLRALELIESTPQLLARLRRNTRLFRDRMLEEGFSIPEGSHPIVPVMFGDARPAVATAEYMLDRGIYVIAFSYPVVPKGKARIRVQISAAHTEEQIEHAVAAFAQARDEAGT